jgi:hypothetical protein
MIGIPTPTWLPSLRTAEETWTGRPGLAELDVDDAGADGEPEATLDGAPGVRVLTTVTGEPLPLELQAVTTRAATIRAPSNAADRRGRTFLTRPP